MILPIWPMKQTSKSGMKVKGKYLQKSRYAGYIRFGGEEIISKDFAPFGQTISSNIFSVHPNIKIQKLVVVTLYNSLIFFDKCGLKPNLFAQLFACGFYWIQTT